jgi:hypothetical protein
MVGAGSSRWPSEWHWRYGSIVIFAAHACCAWMTVARSVCGDQGECADRRAHPASHVLLALGDAGGGDAGGGQELVGHQDLAMTQRYAHLSPAALIETVRLLESRVVRSERVEILETAATAGRQGFEL